MDWLRNISSKYFAHFKYFYSHLGHRLFIAFFLSFGVALMDGLGLAMFIPLLQMANGRLGDPDVLGNLSFLISGIEFIGFSFNLIGVLSVIIIFFSIKGVFKFSEGYYKANLQYYFIKKMRFDQVDLLSNYNFQSFTLSDSGKIQNTISGEVNRLIMAYRAYFLSIQAGIMVFVYLILSFSVNPQFTIFVILGGLLINRFYTWIFENTKKHSRMVTEEGHHFQGLLIQMVAFFKYLKASGSNNLYKEKLKNKVQKLEESQRIIGINNSLLDAIREPIIIFIVVIVIILEIKFLSGNISLIILSLLFIYRALSYAISLQGHWNNFMANYGAVENIQTFTQELEANQESFTGLKFEGFKEEIKFERVKFSYKSELVLNDISFSIKKNQTVALVGESGSGKSTILNLFTGIINPSRGEIILDGIPFEKFDVLSFRRRIGYITQEPVIFDDTIFDNVTFWSEKNEENIKKFWKALDQAAIADFVKSLPSQENSRLGSNGVLVSGGQKQRISIAREMFKEVDIMLLDEATSSLDSDTEKIIQENIESLKGKYTILIIAHRLTTIKNADKILVVSKGEIIGSDSFNILMNSSTEFKKMVSLQEF